MLRAGALALPLVLLLAGCPGLRFGPEGEITDAAYLLRRLDARAARVRSVKGEARVKVSGAGPSGTAGEFVAALRPASLHLETLNFFGKPVGALATDGRTFAILLEEGATYYCGPATAANVARILPVALAPADAVSLLLGDVPRLADAQATLALDRDARAYRLTLTRPPAAQEIWLATEDLRALRSQTRGVAGYDLAFDDYQVIDQVLFPMSVSIKEVHADGQGTGTEVSLHFKDAQVNLALEPELFRLEPPPGARRVVLDELGREAPSQPLPTP